MPNNFFWYDLATSDVQAARKFYCDVVGWNYQDNSQGGQTYGIFQVGDAGVAGLMPYPEGMSPPFPVWNGYIAVGVSMAPPPKSRRRTAIYRGPMIPGVIRFAVAADPRRCSSSPRECKPVPCRNYLSAPRHHRGRTFADWKRISPSEKLFGCQGRGAQYGPWRLSLFRQAVRQSAA